ncbi:MAG: hypothetical protein JWM53_36, partial [bacterium]|nr:hypothetical protein [bacterium]
MIQLNTSYPATAYLTGFLRQHEARVGFEVSQADPALELFLRLFSRAGLERVRDALAASSRPRTRKQRPSASVASFVARAGEYIDTVDAAVRFLQGRDPGLALRIVGRSFLPEGPRFATTRDGDGERDGDGDADSLAWAFGSLGLEDRARHLASLYVDDVADALRDGIDARFELSRYGERLAASA